MLIFLPIGALNNADSGFFAWLAGLGSFVYFCSINMYAYTLRLFLWMFLFLSLFVQSSVYSQLCVHIEPSPRIHRRLCHQHFDALLFCARICFRFFLCTSASSCRMPTWRIRGHAVVSTLVLNLQVQGALTIIKFAVFDIKELCRLKRWKHLVGILFSNRATLRVRVLLCVMCVMCVMCVRVRVLRLTFREPHFFVISYRIIAHSQPSVGKSF